MTLGGAGGFALGFVSKLPPLQGEGWGEGADAEPGMTSCNRPLTHTLYPEGERASRTKPRLRVQEEFG